MKKISKNVKETEDITKEFLSIIKPQKNKATILGLYGDLGTGKTTLTQILAKQLGIKRKVNSPTYVIMKKYALKKPLLTKEAFSKISTFTHLYHIDAYRLKNEKELLHLGWEEIILNKNNLIVIEWPELIIKAMPKKHHQIHISHKKGGNREFLIKLHK